VPIMCQEGTVAGGESHNSGVGGEGGGKKIHHY